MFISSPSPPFHLRLPVWASTGRDKSQTDVGAWRHLEVKSVLSPLIINVVKKKRHVIMTNVSKLLKGEHSLLVKRQSEEEDSSFRKMYRAFLFLSPASSLIYSCLLSEVCVFFGPRPAGVRGSGAGMNLCRLQFFQFPASSADKKTKQKSAVIRRPWRVHRRRRCLCSTWWGGTPHRGSTLQTSCGGRWTPGCRSYSPCSTDVSSSRDLGGKQRGDKDRPMVHWPMVNRHARIDLLILNRLDYRILFRLTCHIITSHDLTGKSTGSGLKCSAEYLKVLYWDHHCSQYSWMRF